MRIEEITTEELNKLTDVELKHLRARTNQVFKSMEKQTDLTKKKSFFLEKYGMIVEEMEKRGLEFKWTSSLDKELFKKAVYGIDITKLEEFPIIEDVVCIVGKYLDNPKAHKENIDVIIKSSDEDIQEMETRIRAKVVDAIGKKLSFLNGIYGESQPGIGLYDLILRPKETLDRKEIVAKNTKEETDEEYYLSVPHPILKPFPNEHAARQTSPSKYDSFASKKLATGIRAILGIKEGKSEVQSVRFSAKKFTVAEAKAWLKEHGFKTSVEPATGKKKVRKFAMVKENEERGLVGGVVYQSVSEDATDDEINKILDADNEFTTREWLEKACHEWMIHYQRMFKQHDPSEGRQPVYVVENFITDEDTVKDGNTIPANSWFLLCQIDLGTKVGKELWKNIKDGEITGWSMGGIALEEDIEEEE